MLPGKLNKLVLNLALTITPSADSRGRCCACDEVSRDTLIRRDSCYEPQLLLPIPLHQHPAQTHKPESLPVAELRRERRGKGVGGSEGVVDVDFAGGFHVGEFVG